MLRKDNSNNWDSLDKALSDKFAKTHRFVTGAELRKDAASSAVDPHEAGKNKSKTVAKVLAELSVKAPILYKMIIRKFGKAYAFGESNVERKKEREVKPEVDIEDQPKEHFTQDKPNEEVARQPDEESIEESVAETIEEPSEDNVSTNEVETDEEVIDDDSAEESVTANPEASETEVAAEPETTNDTSNERQQAEIPREGLSPAQGDVLPATDPIAAPAQEQGTEDAAGLTVDSVDAQANTQDDMDRMIAIEEELNASYQLLQEIQQVAAEQGLLSEEELRDIIEPLRQETEMLLGNLKQYEEGRQRPKEYPGPKRQVGSAERSLEYQSNSLSGKSVGKNDISKARGWHGDPQGHAEAAEARWEGQSGSSSDKPSAPKKPAQAVAGAITTNAKRAAQKAGRVISSTIGETAAGLALDAMGTVAGIVAWRYLSGKSVNPKAIVALGAASTKRGIRHLLNTKRGKQLRMTLRNKEMRNKLRDVARDAGAIASITGAVTAAGVTTASAIDRARASKKPKENKKPKGKK